MTAYFQYGDEAIAHLRGADPRMAGVIGRIGRVRRQVMPDLFAALVHSVVGQQISTKAQASIWRRLNEALGDITPEKILALAPEELQAFGMSFRKAGYIRSAAEKIASGEFDMDALRDMSDDEVRARLSSLNGIGAWSAEMLMIFSMQRPDVFSFGDLAILRGLRMVYHHRRIDRELFEKYRRRFSPYCSVASLYLWEVAGGAIDGMRDFAPKTKTARKGKQ